MSRQDGNSSPGRFGFGNSGSGPGPDADRPSLPHNDHSSSSTHSDAVSGSSGSFRVRVDGLRGSVATSNSSRSSGNSSANTVGNVGHAVGNVGSAMSSNAVGNVGASSGSGDNAGVDTVRAVEAFLARSGLSMEVFLNQVTGVVWGKAGRY